MWNADNLTLIVNTGGKRQLMLDANANLNYVQERTQNNNLRIKT